MHRLTLLVFLALVAVMAAACSVGLGSSPAPAVDGRIFVSTEVQGAALVPGSRIQLTFNAEGVNAHGGCNSISGPYTITGDRFKVTRMASTAMGCEAPLMQQDEWLVDLLEDARIALAGDTLTLDNGQIRLTLLDREVASPDKPLVGTEVGARLDHGRRRGLERPGWCHFIDAHRQRPAGAQRGLQHR